MTISRVTGNTLRALALLSTLASAPAAQPKPRTGKLVDLGGQRLYLDCRGKGTPTVLLEAGAGDPSLAWALVQPRVAKFTRVCRYDRGGYLWSDPGSRPRTYAQLALELRTALDRSDVRPPYVLAGQSYGGLVVRGFAKRYAHDVAGVVLVDAVHEDERIVYGGAPHRLREQAQGRVFPEPHIALDTAFVRMAHDSTIIAADEALPSPLDKLPADAQQLWRWMQRQPLYRMSWPPRWTGRPRSWRECTPSAKSLGIR